MYKYFLTSLIKHYCLPNTNFNCISIVKYFLFLFYYNTYYSYYYLNKKNYLIFFPILFNNNIYNFNLQLNIISIYFKKINYYYLGFYTNWIFIDIYSSTKKLFFLKIYYNLSRSKYIKFLKLKYYYFYVVISQLTLLKNTALLIQILQKMFINTSLKKHKRLFSNIKLFFNFWFKLLLKLKKIKGYSLFFKGKLAKKGSVRKRKIFIKRGLISFTNKNLRLNFRNYILWTETGSVGANINLFF